MLEKINFNAGPAMLPPSVLAQAKEELFDTRARGYALLEASHRSALYQQINQETVDLLKKALGLGDQHSVLFLGGGASLQFYMAPLNLLTQSDTAAYIRSGEWSGRAFAEAVKAPGSATLIYDGSDNHFTDLPDQLACPSSAKYCHFASNETIHGNQWRQWPQTGEVPLVCDMSSDILSRPVPVERFGLIYAGAQKNLGVAGVTLVIIRKDLLDRCSETLPACLSYKTHVRHNSLYNTPPVFGVFFLKKTLEWLLAEGGIKVIEKENQKKADCLYRVIDSSRGFFIGPVVRSRRSRMNIIFTLGQNSLTEKFLEQADRAGFVGLKGHRSLGGIRASLYNAMPYDCVERLADFMIDFLKKFG